MKRLKRRKKTKKARAFDRFSSPQVLERKKTLIDFAAALNAHSGSVSATLIPQLEPLLREDEEMPDIAFVFQLLGRLIEKTEQDLYDEDMGRWQEEIALAFKEDAVRMAKGELHGAVVQVRRSLVELYGAKRSKLHFGLSPRTPRGTVDLMLEAGRLVGRLKAPNLSLPEPKLPGLRVDPMAWVAILEGPWSKLEQLVEELAVCRIRVSDRVHLRRRALKKCDATYLQVLHAAEALFLLADQERLAERLRPKKPKRERQRPVTARVTHWLFRVLGSMRQFVRAVGRRGRRIFRGKRRWGAFGAPALSQGDPAAQNA